MSQHMVIAPGEWIDRQWFRRDSSAINYLPRRERSFSLVEENEPLERPRVATLRRYTHPGWKVTLGFYVTHEAYLNLPAGYVMPGWIVGQELESCPIGTWVHRVPWHRWELISGERLIYAVTCEVLERANFSASEMLRQDDIQPLPPEAANGCPPAAPRPDVPMPSRTVQEILNILNQARGNDRDGE